MYSLDPASSDKPYEYGGQSAHPGLFLFDFQHRWDQAVPGILCSALLT